MMANKRMMSWPNECANETPDPPPLSVIVWPM